MGDYSSFSYDSFGTNFGLLTGISATTYLFSTAVSIFAIVCMWKVFIKAGKNGWEAIIPIYNIIVLFQICKINPYVLLWLLLPIIGWIVFAVYMIISNFRLAKAFGQPGAFGVGLLLVNPVFMGLLAFGKYEYQAEQPVQH